LMSKVLVEIQIWFLQVPECFMEKGGWFHWVWRNISQLLFLFPNYMINVFLYLVQLIDQRKHHEDIYKIWPTNDFKKRINEYPFDTHIISVYPIDNEKKYELELIRDFKSEFYFRSDIENEDFESNEKEIFSVFNYYCSDHLPNKGEEIDMDYL
jgi:hypothetical protein